MHIVIYHPNSFGGTYEYSIHVFEAYNKNPTVTKCTLLLPSNANYTQPNVFKILENDLVEGSKWYKKIHFLYRSLANPIRLWWYLQKQNECNVIFDEFEQLTSFFWSPLFRLTKSKKQKYAVVLHDPDRDAYPPNPTIAALSMKWVMDVMDIGIYHDILVEKSYYKANLKTKYVRSHLGIYPYFQPQKALFEELSAQKAGRKLAAIIGNIRPEKNYHLAIGSLPHFPDLMLVIAGRVANTSVDIGAYKKQAETLGVADRIIWIEKFLDDEQLAAVIEASDIILLNYAATFKSQSAALCLVAPYKKMLLASDGESALALAVKRFDIGELVTPDDQEAMINGLKRLMFERQNSIENWDSFLKNNTWEANIDIAIQAFRSLK